MFIPMVPPLLNTFVSQSTTTALVENLINNNPVMTTPIMSTTVQESVPTAHANQSMQNMQNAHNVLNSQNFNQNALQQQASNIIKPPVQPIDVLSANLASQMFVKEPTPFEQPSVHVPAVTEGFQQLFNSQPQQHYQQAQPQVNQQFEPGN